MQLLICLVFKFHDLEVYKMSKQSYLQIEELVKDKRIPLFIADQIQRAHLSIVLNIAEGSARNTFRDQNRFYYMARSSAAECAAALDIIYTRELIDEIAYFDLITELEKISYMLFRLITSKKRLAKHKI